MSRPVLNGIQVSLDKLVRTKVIVKDGEGNVIANLSATPDGNGNLVVIYKKLKEKCLVEEQENARNAHSDVPG